MTSLTLSKSFLSLMPFNAWAPLSIALTTFKQNRNWIKKKSSEDHFQIFFFPQNGFLMALFITFNDWQCITDLVWYFFWVTLPFLQMQHGLFCVRYHQGDQWNLTTLKSCLGLSYTAWMFSKTVENKISRWNMPAVLYICNKLALIENQVGLALDNLHVASCFCFCIEWLLFSI